jgi:hypothetical protein
MPALAYLGEDFDSPAYKNVRIIREVKEILPKLQTLKIGDLRLK